jgi:GTPase
MVLLLIIIITGYTNAGKSTVLNALTSAGVLAEDMLFATLDPTTRRVKLPGLKVHPEVMFTDTVGFIQKLPTNLVAAFRATLEEVREADVIVHVCDVANTAWPKQHRAVLQVLDELGALEGNKVPIVTLWNKLDLVPENERNDIRLDAATTDELTVAASAVTGEGMTDFISKLEIALSKLLYPVEAVVPYNCGQLISRIHELGACDVEEYTEKGCLIKARVPQELLQRLKPYYTDDYRKLQKQHRDKQVALGGAAAANIISQDGAADWKDIAKGRHSLLQQQQ